MAAPLHTTRPDSESARRHLLAVWNPVLAPDAMEQHIRVRQDAARKYRHGKLAEEQVYVWWGKLQSEHRTRPLPHLDEILGIDVEPCRDDPGVETHVYLTDFASLYVAHLGGVQREPPLPRDDSRVPRFYGKLARARAVSRMSVARRWRYVRSIAEEPSERQSAWRWPPSRHQTRTHSRPDKNSNDVREQVTASEEWRREPPGRRRFHGPTDRRSAPI